MGADDDEERRLRIELMQTQIDNNRVNIERLRQEMRWEPYKALAAIIGGAAAIGGIIVALAHWTHL
jgi:hypothetical protein